MERRGKSSTRAKNKYNSANYDTLRIVIPKGKKDIVVQHAKEMDTTINGLVNELLRKEVAMSKDEWNIGKNDNLNK